MIFRAKCIISSVLLCASLIGYAQVPFNGLIVEEIPIPPAIAAAIQTDHNSDDQVIANPSLAFSAVSLSSNAKNA